MRIKKKLTLWLGLLFALIVLLGGTSGMYIHFLKLDTREILKDNYNSLLYAKNMLMALDKSGDERLLQFDELLKKQEANATEHGEVEMNATLRRYFNSYIQSGQKSEDVKFIRVWLLEVMGMNMEAIEIKSHNAYETATQATIWIIIAGSACFVIALMLLVNLPSHITDPIQKLTQGIKQIAISNYKERVFLQKSDEFGELAQSFNTMAQKLEEYNSSHLAKLMRQKKRIEALINTMRDVVIGLDENMYVIFVNEEACKVLGLPQEDMIGKNSKDIALQNDLMRLLLKQMYANKEEKEPIKIIYNDKENYFNKELLHISITPTGEQNKEVVGHVIILRNITEFKELDATKTRFIGTISHEFKMPIASMKMSLQSLLDSAEGTLNEEQTHIVESIQDDIEKLLKITSELLNLSHIESGNIAVKMSPCNLEKMIQAAVDSNHVHAEQKMIKLEVEIPKETREIVVDADRTVWVLSNLIGNAIMYSHEASKVFITVEQDETLTQIKVRDEGMGIPPEYLDRLFDRYFRVPGTHREGTGLGLSISKELIEAQKGKIEVHSEYGVGSEFVLLFYS